MPPFAVGNSPWLGGVLGVERSLRRPKSPRIGRLSVLVGLLASPSPLGPVAVRAREGAVKSDRELLGRWKAVASVDVGNALPAEVVAANPAIMEIPADKVAFKVGDRVFMEGSDRIDPSQAPKTRTLDLDSVAKGERRRNLRGQGDALKICFVPEGGNRPGSFESKTSSGVTLINDKRAR